MGDLPRWFTVASAVGEEPETLVHGAVVLRGSIREGPQGDLAEELQDALREVLAPAAGSDVRVRVTTLTGQGDPAEARFPFEATLADPHDRVPALEVLRLEAVSAGARRLLPLLAASPAASSGRRLSLRLELEACDATAAQDEGVAT